MKSSFKSEIKTVFKVAKWEYFLKFFTSVVIRGILLVIPVLFSNAINYVTKQEMSKAVMLLLVSIVVTAIYRFFEGFNQVAYYKLYNKLFAYYNDLAVSKTNENSLFSLSRFSLGQYTNMVITDVDIISGFFTASVIRVVQVIEFLVIYLYFLSINVLYFVSAVIVSIVMLFIAVRQGRKVQVLNENRKSQLDNMTSSVHEYFNGIKELKSFNLFEKVYPSVEQKAGQYLDAHAKYNIRFNCNNQACLYVFEAFRLLSVLYGVYLVYLGNMEVGTLLIIYNYYQKIIDNFSTILTINVEYRNLSVSLKRFNKLMEFSRPKTGGMNLGNITSKGKIVFENVLYGFRENPMLDKVSFVIQPNSITALSGKDEAAQNGIFDLLLKLNRQHEGKITIDGVDINEFSDFTYFNMISVARRDAMFFNISIKDNFKMINPDFDEAVRICEQLGVDKEIEKLPNGYDTILNSTTPISQSARELLIIARMLLTDSRILLFDDSLNNLDRATEKKVIDLLVELKKEHTILIICNEKNILNKADKVFVVSDKKVKCE